MSRSVVAILVKRSSSKQVQTQMTETSLSHEEPSKYDTEVKWPLSLLQAISTDSTVWTPCATVGGMGRPLTSDPPQSMAPRC